MPGPGVPPPSLSPFGEHILRKGKVVDRFYGVARAPNVFNPCLGDETRFAPLRIGGPSGSCVPTLYIGETYAAAAFETVFRNMPPVPLPRRILERDLLGRGHSRLRLMRNLKLAPFFEQNLNLIGQTRRTMIETDATAYGETVQWAAGVHSNFPDFDGIIWTSRQHDRDWACVLFGDRVAEVDLHPLARTGQRIDAGPGRTVLGQFAFDYGIDIIPP